ncbi:MAG: MBL fold metallo-hydrolase [Erysipelothrix sp.]
MLVVYELLLLNAVSLKPIVYCVVVSLLSLINMKRINRNHRYLFLLLSLVLFHQHYIFHSQDSVRGIVTTIHPYSYTVKGLNESYVVKGEFEGRIHDFIEVTGIKTEIDKTYRQSMMRTQYQISNPKVSTLRNMSLFKFKIHNEVKDNKWGRLILLNDYHEDFPMLSSFSIQISGVLLVIKCIFRRQLTEEQFKNIRYCVVGLGLFYFDFDFSLIRLMFLLLFNREYTIMILLSLFPKCSHSLSFLLPFGYFLYTNISIKTSDANRYIFNGLVMLHKVHKFSIIQPFTFKFHQFMAGLLFIAALITVLLGQNFVVIEFIMNLYSKCMNAPIIERQELVGTPSVVGIVLLVMSTIKAKKCWKKCVVLSMTFFMLFPLSTRVRYLDVGQGDATLIQFPLNAMSVLIDTGKPSKEGMLSRMLNQYGVSKLDYLIVTHDDLDHSGNVEYILKRYPEVTLIDEKPASVPLFRFLLNDKTYQGDNENSLICETKIQGLRFMFMGDATREQELDIIKFYPHHQIDILKLGHHGSKTSTDPSFIKSIQPRFGMISSDPKTYGHPHASVQRTLYNANVRALETSKEGTISIILYPFLRYITTSSHGFDIIETVIR